VFLLLGGIDHLRIDYGGFPLINRSALLFLINEDVKLFSPSQREGIILCVTIN
jgi:hypothetical protein